MKKSGDSGHILESSYETIYSHMYFLLVVVLYYYYYHHSALSTLTSVLDGLVCGLGSPLDSVCLLDQQVHERSLVGDMRLPK